MIAISALCFVLALASTSAQKVRVSQMTDEISTEIAVRLAQVAREGIASHVSTLELNTQLLNTMRSDLRRLQPQIQTLVSVSGGSPDLAMNLALNINQNQELSDALATDRRLQPRFIGALALGITQVVTDVVKMALTRY